MTDRELADLLRRNPDLALVTDGSYTTVEPATRPLAGKMSEHDLQAAVIAECDRRAILQPSYGLVMAIPNGQYRPGQRMEAGLRPGVPDLFVPCARHGKIGLWIELKVSPNRPRQPQFDWLYALQQQGYMVEIVYDSADEAMNLIEWYLNGEAKK